MLRERYSTIRAEGMRYCTLCLWYCTLCLWCTCACMYVGLGLQAQPRSHAAAAA